MQIWQVSRLQRFSCQLHQNVTIFLRDDRTTIIERGVLRTMLPVWLNSPEFTPLVAGWDQSARQHGGEGAWYVRLKRQPR